MSLVSVLALLSQRKRHLEIINTKTEKMNTQELRLGNIIKVVEGDRQCTVIGIKPGAIRVNLEVVKGHFVTDEAELFSGIPLNEGWFIRFGFEEKKENTGPPINEELTSFVLSGYEFSKDTGGYWYLCGYNWNTKRFKCVHQLQNIFFAIAGEELTLKENI